MQSLTPLIVIYFLLNMVLFLPLRDGRARGQRIPIVTLTLIGINTGIYLAQTLIWPRQFGEAGVDNVLYGLMLVPARIMDGAKGSALTMITSAFLHANLWHLAGNMFFLLFFGRKVEDLLGHTKFLLLYFLCVFVSGIGSVVGESALPLWKGMIPNLGASGAIMGVVGAYLFLYSGEKIRTVILPGGLPIPFFPRVSAGFFIGYLILSDVLNGLLIEQFQKLGRNFSSVNSFAHLSGLVGGLIGIYLFLPREMLHYRYQPTSRPPRSD